MLVTDELEPRIQRLVDAGLSGTDILHGELKNMMYEAEQEYLQLEENADSDEEYEDTVRRLMLEGYLNALVSIYTLTYNLSFAIQERAAANG
jgi:hypothetical protein